MDTKPLGKKGGCDKTRMNRRSKTQLGPKTKFPENEMPGFEQLLNLEILQNKNIFFPRQLKLVSMMMM